MKAIQLSKKYKTILNNYGINTPLRLSHFFAQLEHESNLEPIEENLNYSWQGLRKVFPRHFPTDEIAKQYHRKPILIASRAYANRMQNGNEESRDGWTFRGRGFIQITGKSNYILLSKDTQIDYLNNPYWLLREPDAMISALWFWGKNNLNRYADDDSVVLLTRRINGGYNGLNHRKKLTEKYKEIKWLE